MRADLRPAADQAEILQVAGGERAHRVEIVGVPARHHDNERRNRQLGAMQPLGDRLGDDFLGGREAFGVGELLAIVDDVHAKPGIAGDPAELKSDVARPDDVEVWGRFERVDVDVHLASADEPVFLCEVVVQFVVEQRVPAADQRFPGLPESVVLVAAAADRADRPAIRRTRASSPRRAAAWSRARGRW